MQLFIPPNALARAVLFLKGFYPAGPELPDKFGHDAVFVRVVDTGGAGAYDHVLVEKRLTVEVWGSTWEEAGDVAGHVYALLRAWPQLENGVYWRRPLSGPQRFPDETRKPRYVMTVELAFRTAEEAHVG